jgi:CheY-like chemotaxis protein
MGEEHMNDTKHDKVVLIIEDDPDCRDILSDLLYGHGYEVACAENGRRALDYLRLVTPSLILLDLAMPVMDGREFRRWQTSDARLESVPTIVMTGDSDINDIDADAAFQKPINFPALLSTIEQLCPPG